MRELSPEQKKKAEARFEDDLRAAKNSVHAVLSLVDSWEERADLWKNRYEEMERHAVRLAEADVAKEKKITLLEKTLEEERAEATENINTLTLEIRTLKESLSIKEKKKRNRR